MNFKHLSGLVSVVILFASCGGNGGADAKLSNEMDSVSYFIGYDYGTSIVRDMGTIPGDPMNYTAIGVGFLDGINKATEQVAVKDRRVVLTAYFNDLRQAMADSSSLDGDASGTLKVKNDGLSTVIKHRTDSVGYILGYDYGFNFVENIDQMPGEPAVIGLVAAGFKLGITKDTVAFTYKGDIRTYIMNHFQKIEKLKQDSLLADARIKMSAFLEENKAKEGVMVTESGLQYEIIKEGKGAKPSASDRVKVHYHGTTIDGTVFDSSVDRGEPAEFGVSQVIPGWTEALQMMPVGSKWKLTIPSELAYGDQAAGPNIGPGSVLVFEVELLDILK